MRLKFNQALHLGGKDYGRGNHEVPDAVIAAHRKHVDNYVKAGMIVEADAESAVAVESFQERQKRLAEKLSSVGHKKSNAPEPASQVQMPVLESPPAEDAPASEASGEESSDEEDKSKKKRRR